MAKFFFLVRKPADLLPGGSGAGEKFRLSWQWWYLWVFFGILAATARVAAAQESNQAALVHVEQGPQRHLMEPRYPSVPMRPESPPLQPRLTREAPSVGQGTHETSSDKAQTRLAIAWGLYNQGEYEKASKLFEFLAERETAPTIVEESRLGLAYCLLRLKRLSEAAALLETLVAQGVRRQETVPALVETLLALKRYEEAEKFLPLLP